MNLGKKETFEFLSLNNILQRVLSTEGKVLFIIDSNVYDLFAELEKLNKDLVFIFNSKEENKSLKFAERVWDILSEHRFTRRDTIVAVGGGITLDLAGFVASTYKRGLNFYKVPTSLLAMLDASLGGKTAINYKGIKNHIGTFYLSDSILIDTNFLNTLDNIEYFNGLAELIKYAFIGEKEILKFLENNQTAIKRRKIILDKAIILALKFKSKIIDKDLYDIDSRMFLNFGHTLAHGIESLSNYKLKHGYAVAKGMYFAIQVSKILGLLDLDFLNRFNSLLKNFDYDLTCKFSRDRLVGVITHDKKIQGKDIKFILTTGNSATSRNISIKELEIYLRDLCQF